MYSWSFNLKWRRYRYWMHSRPNKPFSLDLLNWWCERWWVFVFLLSLRCNQKFARNCEICTQRAFVLPSDHNLNWQSVFGIDFFSELFFNTFQNAKLHFRCVEKFFVLIGIVGVEYQVVGVIFSLLLTIQCTKIRQVWFFFVFFLFCTTHSSSMRCRCLTSSFFFLWCIFAYFVYLVNVCFFYSLARFLNLSNHRIQPIPSD